MWDIPQKRYYPVLTFVKYKQGYHWRRPRATGLGGDNPTIPPAEISQIVSIKVQLYLNF